VAVDRIGLTGRRHCQATVEDEERAVPEVATFLCQIVVHPPFQSIQLTVGGQRDSINMQ